MIAEADTQKATHSARTSPSLGVIHLISNEDIAESRGSPNKRTPTRDEADRDTWTAKVMAH